MGFSEYALRLVPFVCGIASLFLFRHLAGLLLRGTALVVAFGVFAVSYPPIRYAAEAKPYGCDLFLALAMLTLAVHWLRRPGENRWLWGLAAMILPAVGFSFPALFTGGGVSLVVGYTLWRSGRRGWLPWCAFNLLLAGGFLAVLAVNHFAVGQSEPGRDGPDVAGQLPAAGPSDPIDRLVYQRAHGEHVGLSGGRSQGRQHGGVSLLRGRADRLGSAAARIVARACCSCRWDSTSPRRPCTAIPTRST